MEAYGPLVHLKQQHGTVGSLSTLRGFEPLMVSGWGIVVNLKGTGSSDVPAHLPGHTTMDLSIGRDFGERVTLSATVLNASNRRFLLDNSETFGGTHYADPRQVYVQLRYRFKL